MSTAGISLLCSLFPPIYRYKGLTELGTAIFVLAIVFQLAIISLLISRFMLFPSTIPPALTRPSHTLFLGTILLSLTTILCNVQMYVVPHAGPRLPAALSVSFWIYLVSTFVLYVTQYYLLFAATTPVSKRNHKTMKLGDVTSAWLLSVFPIMLAGTLAAFFLSSKALVGKKLAL